MTMHLILSNPLTFLSYILFLKSYYKFLKSCYKMYWATWPWTCWQVLNYRIKNKETLIIFKMNILNTVVVKHLVVSNFHFRIYTKNYKVKNYKALTLKDKNLFLFFCPPGQKSILSIFTCNVLIRNSPWIKKHYHK